jgi:hypothetical protein
MMMPKSTSAAATTSFSKTASSVTSNPMNQNSNVISAPLYEFLLTELSNYAAQSCRSRSSSSASSSGTDCDNDENLTVAAEMAAAKLERMGTYVRYTHVRVAEEIAQGNESLRF